MSSRLRNKRNLITTFCLCFVFLVAFSQCWYQYKKFKIIENKGNSIQGDYSYNILDGCHHVYIDVGTNIGVQIRKLFEPQKYPGAYVHPIFDSMFGNITERLKSSPDGGHMICAIGFEPNSHHTSYLKEVETSYQKCGWRVNILTQTAASDRKGTSRFYSDQAYKNMEWGGGILSPNINKVAVESKVDKMTEAFIDLETVELVRLSDFLKNIVATRKLPNFPGVTFIPNGTIILISL